VLQFTTAELVAPGEYRLGGFLRGQAGTDAVMPALWPAGSEFVLIDGAVGEVGLTAPGRGVERHYRIGPATRPYDDPSYEHEVVTFEGIGLRPYRPGHLAVTRRTDGTVEARWCRRTRVDGDGWLGLDVPIGEEAEIYLVRIRKGTAVVREREIGVPRLVYSVAEQVEDGASGTMTLEVAQVSARFGPGPFERMEFDG
jgi:hypothetical protein